MTAHHHMLKNTTVASGPWEGVDGGYHGRFEDGAPIGASYLYFVGENTGCRVHSSPTLRAHPGAIDLWLGGHTHTNPDDTHGGRSHVERKWGVTFVNVAAISRYHGKRNISMSRLLTFTEGTSEVNIRCYLHMSDYAAQGWYDSAERTAPLRKAFSY